MIPRTISKASHHFSDDIAARITAVARIRTWPMKDTSPTVQGWFTSQPSLSRFRIVDEDIAETPISSARNAFSICGGTADISALRAGINRIRLVNVFVNRATAAAANASFKITRAARNGGANWRELKNPRRCCRSRPHLRRAYNKSPAPTSAAATSPTGFESSGSEPAVVKGLGIQQPQICRLRLAPASGISALPETWPSG